MRKIYLSFLALTLALFTSACGGGGDSAPAAGNPVNPQPPVVLTGVFVDAPVAGLAFVSGSQTGTTDAVGTFKFEAGKTVQFRLGNVILGKAPGKALLTPVDLVQTVDATAGATHPRVIQIVQLLMTVNANLSTAPTMSIPAVTATTAQGEAVVDLSQATVDVAAILGRIVPAKPPVVADVAAVHIQASLTALTALKTGTYAAVDSPLNPTVGVVVDVTPNAIGNAFTVAGKAVSAQGATWEIDGTMSTDGAFLATGTGTGDVPPANMTITGAMTSATQLTTLASFTLNNVPRNVNLTFEKAVTPAAALQGKFALATDAGVTNAAQTQHLSASMTILPDGRVSTSLLESEITGLPLAPVSGGRVAKLSGVVTSAGTIITIGGIPGEGETTVTRSTTPPASAVLLMGTTTVGGAVSATVVKALDITGGGATIPALSLVPATNPFAGIFVGTHSDAAPNPPGTTAFGVNNDGSVHGFARFMTPGARFPESDSLLDGVVTPVTGAFAPPVGFNFASLGGAFAAFPGLVMTDDEGTVVVAPGTFAGTIAAGTGTFSGTWQIGPAPLTTGTFAGNLLP